MFRRRAKGLFDFLTAILAAWTLVRATPVGEVGRRGYRWATGARVTERPLASFYENAGDFVASKTQAGAPKPLPEPLRKALEKARPAGEVGPLLKALAVVLAPEGAATIEFVLPAPAVKVLERHGATAAELSTPTGRMVATARALHEMETRVGGIEPSLVALFVGEDLAAYASSRARAAGAAPTLASMLPHLPLDSRATAEATVAPALALATAFELQWPCNASLPIASPFGMRIHPVLKVPKMHTGVDISMVPMTNVAAALDGTVKRVGDDGVNGRFVVVDHGRGVTTAYCHNTGVLVRIGDKVARGQLVAHSGATGRVTGPHLHYQLEIGGTPVDPVPFRPGG